MLAKASIPPILDRLEETRRFLYHLKTPEKCRLPRCNISLDVDRVHHLEGDIAAENRTTDAQKRKNFTAGLNSQVAQLEIF